MRIRDRKEFFRRLVIRRVTEGRPGLLRKAIIEVSEDEFPEERQETRAWLFEAFGLKNEPPADSKQELLERLAELHAKQAAQDALDVVRGPRPDTMSLHQAVHEISMLEFSEEQKKAARAHILKHYGVTPRDEQPVSAAAEMEEFRWKKAETTFWLWIGVIIVVGFVIYSAHHYTPGDGDSTPAILWRFVP